MSWLDAFLQGAQGPTGPQGPAGTINASWQYAGSTVTLGPSGFTQQPDTSITTTSGVTEALFTANCPEGFGATVEYTVFAYISAGSGAIGVCTWDAVTVIGNSTGTVQAIPGVTMTPSGGVVWKGDTTSGMIGPSSISPGTPSGANFPVNVTGPSSSTVQWSVWVDTKLYPLT